MESFLKKIWDSKVWIIATMMLTFCASEISSSFSELRSIWSTQLDFSVVVNDLDKEKHRQNQVLDLYKKSINDLEPLLDFYQSKAHPSSFVAPEEQRTGKQYADSTRERLRVHYAALQGIRLSCVECRELQSELLVGIGLCIDLAEGFVTFFNAPNEDAARSKIINLYNENMSRNLSIAATVIPAFTLELNKAIAELLKNIEELGRAKRLGYIITLCAIYVLIFFVVAIWQYLKHRKSSESAHKDKSCPNNSL
jgi:hypothetical protein